MFRAVTSFCGAVSMAEGEVRENLDLSIADDLMRAGYIVKVEAVKADSEEKKPRKRKLRKENKNESGIKSQ